MPMRFLSLYKPGKDAGTVPPSQEEMAKVGKLCEDMAKRGALLATEGCQHSSKGARIRISGEKFIVTDGPFSETKELIAGFALLQARSKDEAIELVQRFLNVMGEGECELRQLYDSSDCPAQAATYR
jgi:hypothetical protein